MSLDLGTVFGSQLDVHADRASCPQRFEHRRIEDQRAAVGDSRLDDDVRLDMKDELLQSNDVLGQLDDRAAEPGEAVDALRVPTDTYPRAGHELERFWVREGDTACAGALDDLHDGRIRVDAEDHLTMGAKSGDEASRDAMTTGMPGHSMPIIGSSQRTPAAASWTWGDEIW